MLRSDTDSVFCHLPGLNLQQAAEFGDSVSKYFSKNILPYPQKLEFEKVYMPFALYKKKMYSGLKFESNYGIDAKSKLHSRGIALVRRDNARLVRHVMKRTLDVMLDLKATPEDAVRVVADHIALVEASIKSIHDSDRPAAHIPMEDFVISGGISKELDDYAGVPNSAACIAKRLMELNPLEKIGLGSRVTFVICKSTKGARRAEQAELVSDVVKERKQLDNEYYIGAIKKKCEPLLSALFAEKERELSKTRSVDGTTVLLAARCQMDRDKMSGQLYAEKQLAEAVLTAMKKRHAEDPPRARKQVDAFATLRAGTDAVFKKAKKLD